MVDYSVWDHIEVSDDEDETHPNIDTASLFRWRHQVGRGPASGPGSARRPRCHGDRDPLPVAMAMPPFPPQLNHVSALPLPSAALPSVAVSFADVPVKIPRLGVTPQAVAALVGPLPGVHSRVSPERVRAREGLPARRTRRGLLGKQPEPPASLHGL